MKDNFLDLLENKNDLEFIKKSILKNKNLINKEFKIDNDTEQLTYSPLTYCLEKKLSELSIFLIEQGANINYKTSPKEDYPLLIACRYGLEDVIKKLLLYDNIDINCLNKDNETCYTILLNNLNVTIYNLIIEYVKQKKNNNNVNNRKNNKSEHIININNIDKNKNKKKIMIKSLSFDSPLECSNSKNCKYILYYIICLNNIFFKFF
jgi:ankyrin repeat protein